MELTRVDGLVVVEVPTHDWRAFTRRRSNMETDETSRWVGMRGRASYENLLNPVKEAGRDPSLSRWLFPVAARLRTFRFLPFGYQDKVSRSLLSPMKVENRRAFRVSEWLATNRKSRLV